MRGAIFIQGDTISNILEISKSVSELESEYPEYQWHDLSDLYISPGLIDLNVCFNSEFATGDEETAEYEGSAMSENSECGTSMPKLWEGYEIGTKAAVAGGVTTVIESPSLLRKPASLQEYTSIIRSLQEKNLYCDVGFLANIHNGNLCDIEEYSQAGILGFKAYVIPPGFEIPFLTTDKLHEAYSVLQRIRKPIFFHPEKANERYLYMCSPFRNETLISRKYQPEPRFAAFPAAFPDEIEGSESEVSPISSSNSTPMRNTPLSAAKLKSDEKLLERQIQYQGNNLETLIKAEIMTYSSSGFTFFEPESPIPTIPEVIQFNLKIERSPMFKANSPVKALVVNSKGRRPPPIACLKIEAPKENSDYKIFLANCPPHWEVNGVQSIIADLKKYPQCKVHISNLSSANALYAIRKNKRDQPNMNLTCETAGFYLYFSDEDIKPGDTRFKCNPPIREEKNRKLLLDMLQVNAIDAVSSYHRNIQLSLKFLSKGDFKRAVSGISSIGTTLQVLWTVLKGDPRTSACKLARLLSETPAKILGLENKGSITIGNLADLVIWDPNTSSTFQTLNSRDRVSPFISEKLEGKIMQTYLRGKLVFNNGVFTASGQTI